MKKKATKFLFPLLMAVVLLGTACQSGDKKEENKKSPSRTEQKKDIDNLKVTTLTGTETYIKTLFAQAELTVVNIWNPSCTGCEDELNILGELSRDYAGKGVQMIGLLTGVPEDQNRDALAFADNAGAYYTQLLDSDELKAQFSDPGPEPPAALFVDRDGNILDTIKTGDKTMEQWMETIEKYHSKVCTNDHPAESGVG